MRLLEKKWIKNLIIFSPLFFGICGLIFANAFKFTDGQIRIPCIYYISSGYMCPGCGGTRAIFNFFRFNFITSFKYNLVLTLFYFYIVFIYFRFLYQYVFKKKYSDLYVLPTTIIFVVLIVGYNILRNLIPGISIA